jgi:hypothetical protein
MPQLDSYNDLATLLNVVDALVPIAVIDAKQTITIKANITAYSTAVGPASETRKRRIFRASDFIRMPLQQWWPLAATSATYIAKSNWKPTFGSGKTV